MTKEDIKMKRKIKLLEKMREDELEEFAPIPETNLDYWVSTRKRLFSFKNGKLTEKKIGSNGVVTLFCRGIKYQPMINTCMARAFRDDGFLNYETRKDYSTSKLYRDLVYHYDDINDEEVQDFLDKIKDKINSKGDN